MDLKLSLFMIVVAGCFGYLVALLKNLDNKLTTIKELNADRFSHLNREFNSGFDELYKKLNSSKVTILTDMATYNNELAIRINALHDVSHTNHAKADQKIEAVFQRINAQTPRQHPSL